MPQIVYILTNGAMPSIVNKNGVRDNFPAELAAYDGTADERFRKSGG